MRAMVVSELGGPEVLKLEDRPKPKVGEHDLLVEVVASAINPVDIKIRQSGLGGLRQPPFIPGYDVSGIVREVGSRVENFKPGDEVYASPSLAREGANAEWVTVDYRTAAGKPESIDHEHAATLPLVTITAWDALHKRAQIHDQDTVLIHAGAGGVGHIAIQLAKLHRCRVLTTASRDESIQLCRDLGADVVINYREEDFVQRVMEETGGRGCPVVFDTVGGEVFQRSLDCVAINGRVVTIVNGQAQGVHEKLFTKNATLHFEFMGVPTIHGIGLANHGEILRTAGELVDADRLKVHLDRTINLEDLAEGHRHQESGHTTGKIAVRVKT